MDNNATRARGECDPRHCYSQSHYYLRQRKRGSIKDWSSMFRSFKVLVFRAQEPLGSSDLLWSRVARRPSVVRRPLNYLHFRLLLQNHLMDFDETWYGWSTQGPLQVLLTFGQIRRGADPGRGKNRSRGVPFFKKLLLQSGRLQQQTECIAVI